MAKRRGGGGELERQNFVVRSGPRGGERWYRVEPDRRYSSGFREVALRGRPRFGARAEFLDLRGARATRWSAGEPGQGSGGRFGRFRQRELGPGAVAYAAASVSRELGRRDDPRAARVVPVLEAPSGFRMRFQSHETFARFAKEENYKKVRREIEAEEGELMAYLAELDPDTGDVANVVQELGELPGEWI